MRRPVGAFVIAVALASPGTAADLGLELAGGYFDMGGARRSAKAVFDGPAGGVTGRVGVRADFGERLFLRLSGGIFQRRGERVFVADADAPVFGLGHPLDIRLVPVYLDAAWRFRSNARLRPYVGVGVGAVLFKEESSVADETIREQRTRGSARVIVGASWGDGPLRIGAEIGYSRTPDTIGVGGVSRIYGEKDLGGASVLATLVFRP